MHLFDTLWYFRGLFGTTSTFMVKKEHLHMYRSLFNFRFETGRCPVAASYHPSTTVLDSWYEYEAFVLIMRHLVLTKHDARYYDQTSTFWSLQSKGPCSIRIVESEIDLFCNF